MTRGYIILVRPNLLNQVISILYSKGITTLKVSRPENNTSLTHLEVACDLSSATIIALGDAGCDAIIRQSKIPISFTERQIKIVQMIADEGLTFQEIGNRLYFDEITIRLEIAKIAKKLKNGDKTIWGNREYVVGVFIRNGWIQ